VPLLAKILKNEANAEISQANASDLSTPFLSFNFVGCQDGKVPIINVKNIEDANVEIDEAHFDKQHGMKVFKTDPSKTSKKEIK
jgi:hypothetical protein